MHYIFRRLSLLNAPAYRPITFAMKKKFYDKMCPMSGDEVGRVWKLFLQSRNISIFIQPERFDNYQPISIAAVFGAKTSLTFVEN